MKAEELIEKFKTNASYSVFPSHRIDDTIKMIFGLEEVNDISELTGLLI